MTETCVCCGAEIPEGRQVCPNCEKKNEYERTHYVCLKCKHLREIFKPNEPGPNRPLEQFCYYCRHPKFPRYRKIGHKATWTGLVPKWCPKEVKP